MVTVQHTHLGCILSGDEAPSREQCVTSRHAEKTCSVLQAREASFSCSNNVDCPLHLGWASVDTTNALGCTPKWLYRDPEEVVSVRLTADSGVKVS